MNTGTDKPINPHKCPKCGSWMKKHRKTKVKECMVCTADRPPQPPPNIKIGKL